MDGSQIIHISYVIFLNWINFYNGYYFGLSFLKYGPHSYFLCNIVFLQFKKWDLQVKLLFLASLNTTQA